MSLKKPVIINIPRKNIFELNNSFVYLIQIVLQVIKKSDFETIKTKELS